MNSSPRSDDPDLQVAFGLLADIVREMHAAGKRTYSAGVKPQLLARTNGGFDEHTLGPGFPSFRAFLNAAADAGVVSVAPAPVGPDVELLPPGAPSLGPKSTSPDAETPRIRKDFWDAFVDWTPRQLRAYDRAADVVQIVSAEPAPLEPTRQTILRESIRSDSARWIEITPLAMEQQREMMQRFVDALQPTPQRAALQTALAADKPLRAFINTLSIDSELHAAFVTHRVHDVAEVIRGWIAEHELEIDLFESPGQSRASDRQDPPTTESQVLQAVRALIHAAVDRMPLNELNRLEIPVEYFVEL